MVAFLTSFFMHVSYLFHAGGHSLHYFQRFGLKDELLEFVNWFLIFGPSLFACFPACVSRSFANAQTISSDEVMRKMLRWIHLVVFRRQYVSSYNVMRFTVNLHMSYNLVFGALISINLFIIDVIPVYDG